MPKSLKGRNLYQRSETYFNGYLDARLYLQKWKCPDPKGVVIITHGQGEHSDAYHRVVNALEPCQFNVWAWDWRGHGRSEGVRGYAKNFNDYVRDFEVLVQMAGLDSENKGLPLYLLAHSMGGLIQLKGLLSNPQWNIKAQILSAPQLGLMMEVPPIKEKIGKIAAALFPILTLSNGIANEMLTRDSEVLKGFERDTLRHDRVSAGVYFGSWQAIDFVNSRVDKLTTPTLFQIPENDPVVSSPATRAFFEKIPPGNKTLKIYPNNKHEIYNDIDREQVFQDLRDFLAHQK